MEHPGRGYLWPLSVAPLAEALTTYAPNARRRRVAIAAALACYAVAVVIGPQMASVGMAVPSSATAGGPTVAAVPTYVVSDAGSAIQAQIVAGITVLPALLAGFLPAAWPGWAGPSDAISSWKASPWRPSA